MKNADAVEAAPIVCTRFGGVYKIRQLDELQRLSWLAKRD
jgi:hypothetical protein